MTAAPATRQIIGREAELAAIERLLERVPEGAAALVLEGEAGIGKTTIWRAGIAAAEDRLLAVLACRPGEAEAKLSYSGLGDLLRFVPAEVLRQLPGPQRVALEAALLEREPGSPPDRRTIAVGVLSALQVLAACRPLLLAIDDVQWLDSPTRSVLEYALRRVAGERVAVLVSVRSGHGETIPLQLESALEDRCEQISVGPLSIGALHHLLRSTAGFSPPRPTMVRIHQASRGNPLYALEIARLLADRGEVAHPDRLPVPERVTDLIAARLRRLPAATRKALLRASGLARPSVELVDADALAPAEDAGVIAVESDGRIAFLHPLFTSAVYAAALPAEKRRLHRDLARLVEDPEERALHLALSSNGADARVAAELDAAAALALQRGAPDAAAELTKMAIERTPMRESDARRQRSVDLVERLSVAGDTLGAIEVGRSLLGSLEGASRVRTLLLLAELSYWSDGPYPAAAFAEEALACATGDQTLEAWSHTQIASHLEFDTERSAGHARRAVALVEGGAAVPAAVEAAALSLLARNEFFLGNGLDATLLDRAIEIEQTAPAAAVGDRAYFKRGQWLKYVDDLDGSRHALGKALDACLDEGDDHSRVNVLMNLSITETWAGRWGEAAAHADAAVQLAHEIGLGAGGAETYVAYVAAHRGEPAPVLALADRPSEALHDVLHLRPLALLALSQGNIEQAYRYSLRSLDLLESASLREPAVFRIHADAIESAIAAGDVDGGEAVTLAITRHARRSSVVWNHVVAARARALVAAARGDLDTALTEIEAARLAHERLPVPFELARTLLVAGKLERRTRHRSAAKESIGRATVIFEQLGASLWAEQARAELARVGLHRGSGDGLTESESRVAELAAAGFTNREIAAKAFMSEKTVEYNLTRVYRKLEVRSRTELVAALASGPAAEPEV